MSIKDVIGKWFHFVILYLHLKIKVFIAVIQSFFYYLGWVRVKLSPCMQCGV
jgi:hypothetical protein